MALLGALISWSVCVRAQDPSVPIVNWRYDEDWSVLRAEPADQKDWRERLKYVALDERADVYLSTGIEARARYEGFEDNLWGAAEAPDDGYLWLRLMPHADLHAGPLRFFAQGIAAYAEGVQPEAGPADETGIDLAQGFFELALPIGPRASVTLGGGRQQLVYGSERLIGMRYGPNVPLPFDGARMKVELRGLRVDLMAMRPVSTRPGNLNDATSDTRRLNGVYASAPRLFGKGGGGVDAYFLDYTDEDARFDQGAGRERRQTFGIRAFGRKEAYAWNWEAMLQRGHFAGAPIRAWSIATETSRRFEGLPLKPMLRLRANIASGDRDPAKPGLGTFNAMFPKGKYFGELSPIGPYNIANLHPDIELDLGDGFGLGLTGVFYWRQSRDDGIYDLPGNLLRSGSDSRARYIGSQGEIVLSWQASDLIALSASLSAFEPGRFIHETGPARTIRMVGLEAMLRL